MHCGSEREEKMQRLKKVGGMTEKNEAIRESLVVAKDMRNKKARREEREREKSAGTAKQKLKYKKLRRKSNNLI